MTYYTLTQRVTRPVSRLMHLYMERKRKAESGLLYNPEFDPNESDTPRFRPSTDRYRWVERPSKGLRFVGKVDEIRGSGDGNVPYFDYALVDHRGWYTDPYGDVSRGGEGLAWGEVYQLPARNGESLYVPAVCDGYNTHDGRGNDAAMIDFRSVTSDLKDAIRWADSMAESYAEREKEYQIKSLAEMHVEENDAEIKKLYASLKEVCREARANCDKLTGLDALKTLIRREVKRVRREVRRLRAESRKWESNPWEMVAR